ncbi:hypothetical protein GCK32_014582 [Trichostrongylus colubriformis]|uniref:Uncharacterized protein n=1 Tax=Trichostrongylus colubriformis TaxID=6319 RepID=A0AAN8G7W7_TRICO
MLLDYMDRDSQHQAQHLDGWNGTLLSRQRQHSHYEVKVEVKSEHNTEQPLYCQSGNGGSQATTESSAPTAQLNAEKKAKKNNIKKKRKGIQRSGQSRKCDIRLTERNLLDENAAPNVSIFELGSKLECLQRLVHAIRQIVGHLGSKKKKNYALRYHMRYVMSFNRKLKNVIESSGRNVRRIPKGQDRGLHRCRNDIFRDIIGIQLNPCQEKEQQNRPHFHYFTLSDLEHVAG